MRSFHPDDALFIYKIKEDLQSILKTECQIPCQRHRFSRQNYRYPLNVALFNSPRLWGYFDPHALLLVFNRQIKSLSHQPFYGELLRHELAHYLTHLNYPQATRSHGPEFKNICARYHWGTEIARAQTPTLLKTPQAQEQREKKLQKILALTHSSFQHEAQNALKMAQKYALEYQLTPRQNDPEEELYFTRRIDYGKKSSALIQSLMEILREFFVFPLLSYGGQGFYLEVTGRRHHVIQAHYIYHVLKRTFLELWKNERQRKNLKGLAARNSFFRGLAAGHLKTLRRKEKGAMPPIKTAQMLIKTQNQLQEITQQIYGKTQTTYSKNHTDFNALSRGIRKGKDITLRPGLSHRRKSRFLTFLN